MTDKSSRFNYQYIKQVLELLNYKEKNDGLGKIRSQIKKDFPAYLRMLQEHGETAPGDVLASLDADIGEAQLQVELLENMREDFVLRFVEATSEEKYGYTGLDYDVRHNCAKSPLGICIYDSKDGPRHSPCIYCGVSKYGDEERTYGSQITAGGLGGPIACRYCGTPMEKGSVDAKNRCHEWIYVGVYGHLMCPVCVSWVENQYRNNLYEKYLKLMQYEEHRERVEQFSLMLELGELYRDGLYVIGESFKDYLDECAGGPGPQPGTEKARKVGCFCPGQIEKKWYRHKYCPYHGKYKTNVDTWTNRDRKKEAGNG